MISLDILVISSANIWAYKTLCELNRLRFAILSHVVGRHGFLRPMVCLSLP